MYLCFCSTISTPFHYKQKILAREQQHCDQKASPSNRFPCSKQTQMHLRLTIATCSKMWTAKCHCRQDKQHSRGERYSCRKNVVSLTTFASTWILFCSKLLPKFPQCKWIYHFPTDRCSASHQLDSLNVSVSIPSRIIKEEKSVSRLYIKGRKVNLSNA